MNDAFELPAGVIYLLGHSLGPPAKQTLDAVANCAGQEWAQGLAASWNAAGWFQSGRRLGGKIAALIGVASDEVIVADCVSVNLYKIAVAALLARPERRRVLIEADGFPTDHYILEGACRTIGHARLDTAPRHDLAQAIDRNTGLVVVSHVDYRGGDRVNMETLTEAAHAHGAWIAWDLSHSLGAVEIDLGQADFAVGCGYKYACGGPGAPGFLFVARRHHGALHNPISGWFGHAAPFAFEPAYRASPGIAAFATGTPPILSLAALEAAIDHLAHQDQANLAQANAHLGDLFSGRIAAAAPDPDFVRLTPNQPRGAHIAYTHTQGYALIQALIARGVIGDFRAPDVVRFGFSALYLTAQDAIAAAECVIDVLRDGGLLSQAAAARGHIVT